MPPNDKPDRTEKGIRFGCGTLIGLVIGFRVASSWFPFEVRPFVGVLILVAIVCGLLAVRLGDAFWRNLGNGTSGWDWWDWWD